MVLLALGTIGYLPMHDVQSVAEWLDVIWINDRYDLDIVHFHKGAAALSGKSYSSLVKLITNVSTCRWRKWIKLVLVIFKKAFAVFFRRSRIHSNDHFTAAACLHLATPWQTVKFLVLQLARFVSCKDVANVQRCVGVFEHVVAQVPIDNQLWIAAIAKKECGHIKTGIGRCLCQMRGAKPLQDMEWPLVDGSDLIKDEFTELAMLFAAFGQVRLVCTAHRAAL